MQLFFELPGQAYFFDNDQFTQERLSAYLCNVLKEEYLVCIANDLPLPDWVSFLLRQQILCIWFDDYTLRCTGHTKPCKTCIVEIHTYGYTWMAAEAASAYRRQAFIWIPYMRTVPFVASTLGPEMYNYSDTIIYPQRRTQHRKSPNIRKR